MTKLLPLTAALICVKLLLMAKLLTLTLQLLLFTVCPGDIFNCHFSALLSCVKMLFLSNLGYPDFHYSKFSEFERSPAFKKVVVGSAATLSCSVRSIPTSPELSWEKDGAAFTRSELVTDTSDSNSKV